MLVSRAFPPQNLKRSIVFEQGVNGLRNSKSSGRCLACRAIPLASCHLTRVLDCAAGVHMSSQLPFPPSGFDRLSREEQLEYIEGLLNYVASGERYVEIPDWHLRLLDERIARYRAVGVEGSTWEEFEKELKDLV